MSELDPIRIIEAALFTASAPLPLEKLTKLFPENVKSHQIKKWLVELEEMYQARGIQLVEVASGFRFQVASDVVPFIVQSQDEKPAKFSRALLETLALIAYRQPITRGEIEEIRGVVVSTQIMKTLDELGWTRIVGYKDVPGKPALYATSKAFLDYFGLKNLEALPPLVDLKEDLIEEVQSSTEERVLGPVQEVALEIQNNTLEPVDETLIEQELQALEQAELVEDQDALV